MIQVLWDVITYISAEIGVAVEKTLVKEILNLRKNLFLNTENAPSTWVSSVATVVAEIKKIARVHVHPGNVASGSSAHGMSARSDPDEVTRLNEVLNQSRDELLATKEELKAAKEEVKSVKEELKEEVKTAKEEVKAAKDELKAAKDELKEVKDELKEVKEELKAEKSKQLAAA